MTDELKSLMALLGESNLNYDVIVGLPGSEELAVTSGEDGESITGEIVAKIMALGPWSLYFDDQGDNTGIPHLCVYRRKK